ncbi:hypothetical protein AZE42_05929 [Rhizopogon vesiculosus]|uniref:holocytochrome-c synthase n=1 Tax=Rhizopogon vesiculosus TaxID=180088 RepID=A0A1J8PG33_9AGAM|nr:hypothetical protein AZE42_05929 [Rhizopogon vesiculosus]
MHNSPNTPPAAKSSGGYPIDHSSLNAFNLANQMPNLPQTPVSPQSVPLLTERTMSSIPRVVDDEAGTGSRQTWEYPSPQQFYNVLYNVLVRNGMETPAEHVETVVEIHNFLNERAWGEVLKWEKRVAREDADEPHLARFKARCHPKRGFECLPAGYFRLGSSRFERVILLMYSEIQYHNTEPPFDRHNWIVHRPRDVTEVRYVIDYYSAPPTTDGAPGFALDVRPALHSFESIQQRMEVGMDTVWKELREKRWGKKRSWRNTTGNVIGLHVLLYWLTPLHVALQIWTPPQVKFWANDSIRMTAAEGERPIDQRIKMIKIRWPKYPRSARSKSIDLCPDRRVYCKVNLPPSRIDPTELPTVQVRTSTDILSDTDQEMASETAHGIRKVPYIQELQPFEFKADILPGHLHPKYHPPNVSLPPIHLNTLYFSIYYGAIWDERRILITSDKHAVGNAPDAVPTFPQHPMTRSNVKRSAANTSLPQHVPELPISYYPNTVPSMPQHVLNKPLMVSCAPLVIDRKVPIKPSKPASSHETPSPHMFAMLQEIDEFINEIHDFTFPEGVSEDFANTLAVGSTTPVLSNSSTSLIEQGCRNLPREPPITSPVAAGTPVVKPLFQEIALECEVDAPGKRMQERQESIWAASKDLMERITFLHLATGSVSVWLKSARPDPGRVITQGTNGLGNEDALAGGLAASYAALGTNGSTNSG